MRARRDFSTANRRSIMRGKPTIILLAIVALSLGAPSAAATTVPKGNYVIDPRHTQIIFGIRHMGLSTYYGRFSKESGNLTFDPAAPEASALSVAIDMTAIDTHVAELDKELSSSIFHADKFPTATFTATKIVKTDEHTGTVTGDLTLAGVTRAVTLNVTFNGGRNSPMPFQPYRIGFDATGTIKRSDFGLTKMMWSGFVGDEVNLLIQCEMERH
jgi:polyisoprenoid-binding protein YceI